MSEDSEQHWLKDLERGVERAEDRRRERQMEIPSGLRNAASLLLMESDNPGMDEADILDEIHENPLFYAGISLISSKIAETELFVEINGERVEDHAVLDRLEDPNRYHTKFTWMWTVASYLLGVGTSFVYQMKNGDLIPLPTTYVDHEGGFEYEVRLWGSETRTATLGKDLVKLRLPDLREPYVSGSGYGAALADELDISDAARNHEAAVLHNNARPDMILNFDGLDETSLRKVREKWHSNHEGPDNSGKAAFANAEGMSAEALSTSFSDLGFIELREFSNDQIRRTLGIPPELLGKSDNANRATIEAAFLVFARTVLKPRLRLVLAALTNDLLPLITDDDVRLAHKEVVPEDVDRKLKAMSLFPNAFTVNEVRRLMGYDPFEGGEGDESLDQPDQDVQARSIGKMSAYDDFMDSFDSKPTAGFDAGGE